MTTSRQRTEEPMTNNGAFQRTLRVSGAGCSRLLLLTMLFLSGHQSGHATVVRQTDQGMMGPASGRVAARFRRQEVSYRTEYAPGTVVIDPSERFLYLVQPRGRAIRFGVSVGLGAFAWAGEARIGRKSKFPRWTPTPEMLQRSPGLADSTLGRAPGELNPLGVRALYLFQGGKDTLYRIHGTSEWWSIGNAASAGCIRLLNPDVVFLYDRVAKGAKVVVLPSASPMWRQR